MAVEVKQSPETNCVATRLVSVDPVLIDDNPFNARSFYDGNVIAALAERMRAEGQLVAAAAVRSSVKIDRFTLIDGHYRLQAIKVARLKTILLDVRDAVPDVEMFRLSFALNSHRTPHTVLDNALAWNRLLNAGVVSVHTDLQSITGKSGPTISKTLQLLELPNAVLSLVKKQPSQFSLKLSYALVLVVKAGGIAQATRLAERALVEGLAPNEIEQAIRWAQSGKTSRKKREESDRFAVERDGCVGVIKSWKSGKVVAELSFTEPAKRALFVEQLRHLVAPAV